MDKETFSKDLDRDPFASFVSGPEKKPPGQKEKGLQQDDLNGMFLPTFFMELVDRIKKTLASMKKFSQLSKDKTNNTETREYFYRMIDDDIEEIESILNSLLSYVKINIPIVKMNTIHTILGELIKKNARLIGEKKIRVMKNLAKDLPETTVPEEQLRYVISSIFEYVIPFTLPNGSVGLLTRVIEMPKETEETKSPVPKDNRFIEVVIVFTGYKKQSDQLKDALGTSPGQKEEGTDLKLMLVKDIIRKNRGVMKFEVNEQKQRTLISLVFPIERRKVVHYQSPET